MDNLFRDISLMISHHLGNVRNGEVGVERRLLSFIINISCTLADKLRDGSIHYSLSQMNVYMERLMKTWNLANYCNVGNVRIILTWN